MQKPGLFIFWVLLLAGALPVQAKLLVADSRITGVTVFNDRAMVKRVAAVQLEAGENVVTFEGLPLQISEETLRAEGKGSATARITGLSVRNVFLELSSEKRIRDLESEIQMLETSVQKIDARRTALGAQKAFIDSIRLGWGERISKELSLGKPVPAELNEASRFVGESMLKAEESLVDANVETKPVLDRIATLKKQLDYLNRNRRREVRSVDLTIDAPVAMSLTVELSYMVLQARWEPVYDIRLAPDGSSAELLYRAVVSQNSGEDWQKVNLSLSTATPSIGSAPPELRPWNISLRESLRSLERGGVVMAKSWAAPAPMLAPADSSGAQDAVDEPGAEAIHATSQIAEKQTSVLFVVPKPVDVPADGSRQSSLLTMERIPVKAAFVAIPKLSSGAFLRSSVTNMTAYPLLAGTVNVFNDTAFVGRSHLKAAAVGEKFDLYFGADDAVKVKRQAVKVRKGAGLLAGNQVSWNCAVEIENFRKEEISLSLYDQIPVAGNEEIKVAVRDSRPAADEVRTDGALLWKLTLRPGEKRTVTYRIDVEYPEGREITGVE